MARRKTYLLLPAAALAAWALNTWVASGGAAADTVCILLVVGWIAALMAAAFAHRRAGRTFPAAGFILAAGFVVGMIFILKLPHDFSWHDLASYSADFSGEYKPDGHLGYIAYLVGYKRLPTENPLIEGYSVFYNPPLYHLLQAAFMEGNIHLGLSKTVALENLQVVTMLCAAACPLVAVELMRFIGIGERGVRVGALVMVSQPMLWILGATLNNDILCILLILLCLLFTVRWERSHRMRDIVGIALSLGLGMATKLSTALLIPCVALVFIIAFFRDLKRWKRYAGQFGVFLALSVPEAVAWPLYHLIAYQVPFNYVRLPGETLNVSSWTLSQRFGIPDWYAIRSLFYTGVRKTDHNVWMQTLKTGLYDERILFEEGTTMWYLSYLLLVLFALLLLLSLVFFIRMLFKKRAGLSGLSKGFLAAYGALLIGSYLKFCVDYPYVCSFNFRYIFPVLALCALAFACCRDDLRHGLWVELYAGGFAALSAFVYAVSFFIA